MKSLVPVTRVPALIEAWYGWRPHEMTVYRWTHGTVRRLRTIKRGSRRLTSRGEIRRFMREWSGTEEVKQPVRKPNRKEHDRAVEELRKMGLV